MKLNVISVCSQYTGEELVAADSRTKAQSDFLKLQWEQGQFVRDAEDFLDVLQQSVNENSITVVLDGSDYYYSKTMIAEGLDLALEENGSARKAVEDYCEANNCLPSAQILEGAKLPQGCLPLCSKATNQQGFVLIRGGRCIAVFPAEAKAFAQMFSNGFFAFLLRNGAETAVSQTIALRESKVADVEEYLRIFKHGKNILPLVYEEDGQHCLSVTAIRSTEAESRQACESLLENLQAEMGDVVLTAASVWKENRHKRTRSLPDPTNYDPEVEKPKKNKKEKREKPKKEGMGIIRKLLLFVCICTFLVSSGYLVHRYYQSVSNVQDYDSLREVYDNGGHPALGYPMSYDNAFSGLYQINEDVAGWLSIPGTSLDYPVVQGDDNLYYHRLSFEGDYSLYGVPFVDCNVDLKNPSTNTIIYGHNIKNDDQMFNSLIHYWQPNYFIENPIIDFHTVYGDRQYKIFAAFVANVNPEHGPVFNYHTFINANDLADIQEYIYNVQARSVLNTGVDVLPSDELLTLSTCTYEFENARFVVVARRLRDGESAEVDPSLVYKASAPLMPDIWYQLYGGTKPVLQVPEFEDTLVLSTEESQPEQEVNYDRTLLSETMESGVIAALSTSVQTLMLEEQEETDVPVLENTAPPQSSQTETPPATETPATQTPPSETTSPVVPPVTEAPSAETPKEEAPKQETPPAESAPKEEEKKEEAPKEEAPKAESKPAEEQKPSEPTSTVQEEKKEEAKEESKKEEEEESINSNYDSSEKLSVKLNGKTVKQSAYDIVCMMVQAEMGSSFHQEALKAQAVAAYTYVKYNNNSGVSPSVVGKTSISSNVAQAVEAVLGEAIYYNGKVINSTYCAANAGVSNNCVDVWGGNLPYLVSVESEGDEKTQHYGYQTKLTLDYVADRLESYCGKDPYDYDSDPAEWFGSYSTGAGLYVDQIKVLGSKVKGRVVRETLLQSKIRSAAFEVEYDAANEVFIFTTYGYGHGVGMSQLGANYYAKQGWSYDEILEHYYSGTKVK